MAAFESPNQKQRRLEDVVSPAAHLTEGDTQESRAPQPPPTSFRASASVGLLRSRWHGL